MKASTLQTWLLVLILLVMTLGLTAWVLQTMLTEGLFPYGD